MFLDSKGWAMAQQQKSSREVLQRFVVGVPLLAALIVVIALPPVVTMVVASAVAIAGCYELILMVPSDKFNIIPIGVVYIAMACLLGLAGLRYTSGPGALWFALLVPIVGDVTAFFGGRWWGKRRLAPTVSGGKTVAGAVIGLICATATIIPVHLWIYPEVGWAHGTILALVGGVLAQAGDLMESKVKRICNVKDSGERSGTRLGAHGGFLDRMDSVMPVGLLMLVFL